MEVEVAFLFVLTLSLWFVYAVNDADRALSCGLETFD